MATDSEASQSLSPQSAPKIDWAALRELSLLPGGFGSRRVELWSRLLHVPESTSSDEPGDTTTTDGDASASDVGHRDERQIQLDTERSFVLYPVDIPEKDSLQSELHTLLVNVFRRRPRLNYFQGYHDIITVLFLTLPPEMQLVCAEKLSLQRVRDSMGNTLEPILGLLRVMKNLLRAVDLRYASLLESTAPLPFYALSNLLTLFSHDMPTLPLIQHIFDYLLCRPPVIVVYLATAIILSRKGEIERLEQEGEEGMMHSLLSSLPSISDDVSVSLDQIKSESIAVDLVKLEQEADELKFSLSSSPDGVDIKSESLPESDVVLKVEKEEPEVEPFPEKESKDALSSSDIVTPSPALPDIHDSSDFPPLESPPDAASDGALDEKPPCATASPSPPPSHRASVTLVSLLKHADELYSTYPPTHPSIALASIMGPQSVVFTWSETLADMPSDDDAEAMVDAPELVVRPYVEPDADSVHDSPSEDSPPEKKPRRRRRLRKPRRFRVEGRTMVAGAVLVLGVAMAVYGMHARSPGALQNATDPHVREWRRLGRWVGGVLVGASERILHGFGAG